MEETSDEVTFLKRWLSLPVFLQADGVRVGGEVARLNPQWTVRGSATPGTRPTGFPESPRGSWRPQPFRPPEAGAGLRPLS